MKKVTLANTPENAAKIEALKVVQNTAGKIYWVGNVVHDSLDKCLTAINLSTFNSGWYNPVGVRINGLTGIYMLNQDGSIFCESRVIKQSDTAYLIEYLTTEGWNYFENQL